MTTTRTAAEALEEVLAQIAAVDGRSGMDRLEARLDSANAARNFIMKHAATLRAALAQPQEVEEERIARDLEEIAQDWSNDHGGDTSSNGYAVPMRAARLLRATQSNGHSPVGDESPRQNAKGAEGCHDAPNASGESPAQSALAQEPVITVSGPVACGKSYIMELIYKALRDAGLHPYSDDLAHERRMVEEQPQPPAEVWKLREAVYAAPQQDEAK